METKDVINKKPAAKENPQILEMKQAMQEMNTKMVEATALITARDKEIADMREANVKISTDKLAKEKDLKAAFGIDETVNKPKSADDINALTNVEMFDVMANVMDTALNAHRSEATDEMGKGFKNLDDKFDQVVGYVMKKEADTNLQQMRNTHKDFDDHQADIKQVLQDHQEFSMEDAYDWVIMQKAKGKIAPKHIDSEKPDKDLSAADEDVVRVQKQPEGRKLSRNRQFKMLLNDAIDQVQAERGGK